MIFKDFVLANYQVKISEGLEISERRTKELKPEIFTKCIQTSGLLIETALKKPFPQPQVKDLWAYLPLASSLKKIKLCHETPERIFHMENIM